MTTTNEEIRQRYEDGKLLNDDSTRLVWEGHIAGVTNNYQTIVDPTDHANGRAALQQANDDLLPNLGADDLGYVIFPPADPTGTEFTIDQTVTFGSATEQKFVLPRGVGFMGLDGKKLQCTITDGSPMFEVTSGGNNDNRFGGGVAQWGHFAAYGNEGDAECVRVVRQTGMRQTNIFAQSFDPSTGAGVFVYDTRCFNSYIDKLTYHVPVGDSCPNAQMIVMANDTGTGSPPADLTFGPGITTFTDSSTPAPARRFYYDDVGADSIVLTECRVEGFGAGSTAASPEGVIEVTANGGDLRLAGTKLSRVEGDTTDQIRFDGETLIVEGIEHKLPLQTGGDVIHIPSNNPAHVHIEPFMDFRNNTGDSVHLQALPGGGSKVWTVPRESQLIGTTTYPAGPWATLRYPDGWQAVSSGTTTLSAGGDTELEAPNNVASPGEVLDWEWEFVSPASGGHRPRIVAEGDENNDAYINFHAVDDAADSTGDQDIAWTIERRIPTNA